MKAIIRAAQGGIFWWLTSSAWLGQADAHPPPTPQTPLDDSVELRILESTEQGEDPLGIDVATGSGLEEAARNLKPEAPVLPTAQQGAGLSAIPLVREVAHTWQVELAHGLAHVHVQARFASHAKHRAELSYRLPLPAGAVVSEVRACRSPKACVRAVPTDDSAAAREYEAFHADLPSPAPGAVSEALYAEVQPTLSGQALAVRYASLGPDESIVLELRFTTEAPLRGGEVFLDLPARGEDPNLAQRTSIEVRTQGLILEGPAAFEQDATRPLFLRARLPEGTPRRESVVRARCGANTCALRQVSAGPRPYTAHPTWLWIDASPSMEGPARSRVDAVLAALLSNLPPDTPLTAHAFAAQVKALGEFRADEATLQQLSDATLLDLDAATQPSELVTATEARIAKEKPRIFIVSDGGFDPTPKERQALTRAAERGAELWLLAVGTRHPAPFIGPLHTLHLAADADRVFARGGDLAQLRARLRVALSPELSKGGLRAGEQQVFETRPRRPYARHVDSPWLSFWLQREVPPPRWLGRSAPRTTETFIRALPYASAPPNAEEIAYTGMPAESVLDMLRTQLIPKARACLRQDRRGRADYSVALTFHAHFQAREVSQVRIEGNLPAELRACLTALFPRLRVPAFTGGVRIRYPIHTDRVALPPVIELTPELRETVQRVIEAPLSRN